MQNNLSFQQRTKPQIRIIHANNNFKVILISLKPGSVLKKHTTPERAKIFVVKGTIEYRSLKQKKQINHLEEYNIPLGEVHQVIANEPAEFLLILG